MLEAILSLCCGILIILGLLSVFFGGTGLILGGVSLAYDRPKRFLYFLYFGSISLGVGWILELFGIMEPLGPEDSIEFYFLAYSLAVLIFHAMDYQWQKLGFNNLSEPPKLRWAYGGCNIWFAMVVPFLPYMEDYEFEAYGGVWGLASSALIFGLALVWWATTELE
jgi:hypothetical protein